MRGIGKLAAFDASAGLKGTSLAAIDLVATLGGVLVERISAEIAVLFTHSVMLHRLSQVSPHLFSGR